MNRIDKRRLRLSILDSFFNSSIRQIEELSRLAESLLKKEREAIIARAEKEITDDLSDFDKRFIAECYAEDIDNVQEGFPRILRYSLFVTAMSKLECDIVGLCRGTRIIFKIQEDFNPKAPNVINRAVEYLKKNTGIDKRRLSHYVKLLDEYRIIRNCVVHSEGVITERGKDEPLLRQYIANSPLLSSDRDDRIILLEGFVTGSVHSMHLLWDRLLSSIERNL
jgi:hypothetical protein